jgi:hypothetical protein
MQMIRQNADGDGLEWSINLNGPIAPPQQVDMMKQ